MNKTPYIMFNFPNQDYAIRYCKENGLFLGNTYFIIDQPDEHNVFIRISDDKNTMVGKIFFKQHFKIDLRTINLEKLV